MPLFVRHELKTLSLPPSLEPRCHPCGIFKTCKSKKMPHGGKGRKKILVVGEAPGAEEDERGTQFAGNSGREVEKAFRKAGITLRDDCWLDNALACHPAKGKIPHDHAIADCRPHVIRTVTELKPEVIVLLGGAACESLLGWLWKEDVSGVTRWAGYRIPHRGLNAWICPTYHPAYLQYEKSPVPQMQFEQHVRAAAKLKGRPYAIPPQPDTDFCENVLDDRRMAEVIRNVSESAERTGMPVAFDYETTTAKPHGPHAEIYTCSIAATEEVTGTDFAWSFPWRGKVIPAMKEFFANPKVKKVGSNIKFEMTWTSWHLGVDVRGWQRDTMLAAHALENGSKSRRVTGIKFQAFAHLGVDEWDSHVREYLKSPGGNTPNRIKHCPLQTLLTYNCLDSLYELQVGRIQTRTIEGDSR